MFWNRNEDITPGRLGPVLFTPIQPSKEFKNMYDLLMESERYDRADEPDLVREQLNVLKRYIETYLNNQIITTGK